MKWTVDGFLYWLRNGDDARPFLEVQDIVGLDEDVEVIMAKGYVYAIDTIHGFCVRAPLDKSDGQIVWEEWRVMIPEDECPE